MTPAAAVAASPGGAGLRDVLAWSLAAGSIVALAEFAGSQHGVGDGWRDRVDWFVRMLFHWVLAAAPFALAFAWLDRRAVDRVPPWHEYALVVVGVASVVAPLLALVAPAILGPLLDRLLGGTPDFATMLRFLGWQVAFWAALGALLHRNAVAGRLAAARLRRAELRRAAREHAFGRASLRATLARVVPGFLLGVLRRIAALYGRAPSEADRAIGSLVAYLRLALMQQPQGVVAVTDEFRLVEAYLHACGDDVRDAAPPELPADAAIEPGIVVPVLHRLRDALVRSGETAAAAIGVEIASGDVAFRVRLEGAALRSAPALPLEADVDAANGGGARIGARREAGGAWSLAIALPLAPQRSSDDPRQAPGTGDDRAFFNSEGGPPWTRRTSNDAA